MANSEKAFVLDSHDDRTPKRVVRPAMACGDGNRQTPDYRAIARQLAKLSAEAASHAQATGDEGFDRLARRLDHCADAILDDLDRDRTKADPRRSH